MEMDERIRTASLSMVLGAYLRHCGVSWLACPLQMHAMPDAVWVEQVVDVAMRTTGHGRAAVLAELRTIDHALLRAVLTRVIDGSAT